MRENTNPNSSLPSFEELYASDGFESVVDMAFLNIKNMLDAFRLTARQYSNLTGYNRNTVLSWLRGELEPPSGKNIHGATVYHHKERTWVVLHGAKERIEYEGSTLTLNENTGRIVGKSWEMTGEIIDNGSFVSRNRFLLDNSF